MVRIIVIVAVFLSAGLGLASADPAQRTAPRETPAPAQTPNTVPPANPLDVPRWMGDAIGHILSDDEPAQDTRPIRQ